MANAGAGGAAELHGFAYGEALEQGSGRSLGYRLVTLPPRPEDGGGVAWLGEVEELARRLQAAPYPDHWPPADLFASILLAGGERLVAVARYGLLDTTPAARRGGFELIGVVGPGSLDVATARGVERWLRARRVAEDELPRLGGAHRLADVLAADPGEHGPTVGPAAAPSPVLPVRIWQDGAFLFAASSPVAPDDHLHLLELGAGTAWQWLPLIGPDFPLARYAKRGPVVAWTAHLASVALRLDAAPGNPGWSLRGEGPPPAAPRPGWAPSLVGGLTVLALLGVGGLLAAVFWELTRLRAEVAGLAASASAPPMAVRVAEPPAGDADRFMAGLYKLLAERGGARELDEARPALLEQFAELAARDKDLRAAPGGERGQVAVAAVAVLAGRSADRIEGAVRRALVGKGFSDKVVNAACDHVREHFARELKDRP